MPLDRRGFLRALGAAPLVLWPGRGWAVPPRRDRALVLVELEGGNDGLNTAIPYADPLYRRVRPGLAVAPDQVLRLNDSLGLHPSLEPLLPAWKAGELALVQGVGYPSPNRSHFRSIRIWETASAAAEELETGWVARLVAAGLRAPRGPLDGVALGRGAGPLRGDGMRTLVMNDPALPLTDTPEPEAAPPAAPSPALSHLLAVADLIRLGDAHLRERLARTPDDGAAFPGHALGRQLHLVHRLLRADVGAVAFKVGLGGFDTHVRQARIHARLLGELAESLAAFRDAAIRSGLWDRVALMTYSEFGRRVRENANAGTDHGAASVHFVLGGRVRGGLLGRQPPLTALADGDLEFEVDFRSLYATIARDWWGIPGGLSGGEFRTLPLLRRA